MLLVLDAGFAFVYMRDKRDGDEAIRKLDRMEYGYKRRQLRCEWAKVSASPPPPLNPHACRPKCGGTCLQ